MGTRKKWGTSTAYFGLAPPLSRTRWRALERAQWSEAHAFRHSLLLFDARPRLTPDAVVRFVDQVASPQRLIELLEALVQEGRLSRHEANTLMEAVLARVKEGY